MKGDPAYERWYFQIEGDGSQRCKLLIFHKWIVQRMLTGKSIAAHGVRICSLAPVIGLSQNAHVPPVTLHGLQQG
jgi:hypothetical protein